MAETCSIILTCYNKGAYIYAAMACCVKQQATEVLIVDDGSSDDSAGEMEKGLRCFTGCVRVIYQRNGGAAKARNRGFDTTTAQLVLFMDGDDLLPEGYLTAHLAARKGLKELKYGITYANFSRIYANGTVEPAPRYVYKAPVDYFLGRDGGPVIHSWLWPRTLLEKSGHWREDVVENDDFEFAARAIANSSDIICAEQTVAFYRMVESSLSHRPPSRQTNVSILEAAKTRERCALSVENSPRVRLAVVQWYYNLLYLPSILRDRAVQRTCWRHIRTLGGGYYEQLAGKRKLVAKLFGQQVLYVMYTLLKSRAKMYSLWLF